ncbi:hypothetical protein TIFTF001_007023 [Ficus carica]|uniref:Uncharacterized protein n=1 Tax=Ficus carica TaxID=3494 RepID=A0AA88ACH6_FICCA|nr:hypothetical protein TIFTF001_007023 [Ficus carica]
MIHSSTSSNQEDLNSIKISTASWSASHGVSFSRFHTMSKVFGGAETEVLVVKIPCLEAGLPEGIKSIHMAPTLEMQSKFLKACGRKALHIGPLFLYEIGAKQRVRRGMEASIEEHECLKWLDSKKSDSVVYVSFGSVANFTDDQLMEIAAGLEASGQQFIWVVKKEKREGGGERRVVAGWIRGENGGETTNNQRLGTTVDDSQA